VYERLRHRHPQLERNRNFGRDAFNVVNGIVWQLQLIIAPICLVIRQFRAMWISLAILVVTSVIMKYAWYDTLEEADVAPSLPEPRPAPSRTLGLPHSSRGTGASGGIVEGPSGKA